jgi:hypothetical protein
MPFDLNCSDQEELERRARSQSLRAGDVRKARLLLLLTDDQPYTEIQRLLGCSSAYISRKSGLRAKVWPVCVAGTKVERRLC